MINYLIQMVDNLYKQQRLNEFNSVSQILYLNWVPSDFSWLKTPAWLFLEMSHI